MNNSYNKIYQTILFYQLKNLDNEMLNIIKSNSKSKDEMMKINEVKKLHLVIKMTNLYGGLEC